MKKKNRILNAVMVVLIAVIIVSGVIITGNIRGWFDKDTESSALASKVRGTTVITRSGVGFNISEDTALREGDVLETANLSEAVITSGESTLSLGEKTALSIGKNGFSMDGGEYFLILNSKDDMSFSVDGTDLILDKGTYGISVQSGSWSVSVYDGKASSAKSTADKGEIISEANGGETVVPFAASSLNEFSILKAMNCKGLCFTKEELQGVIDAREEEKRIALEELAAHEAQVLAQGGTVAEGTTSQGALTVDGADGKIMSCTIQIRCDTILNNMKNLSDGKNVYVPANGIILTTSTVQFVEGETVFEVLNRVCSYAGIQIEYSWTPLYDSYYIEGINHLYEFDCGELSGWMYKVNGWFPNYGCSSYYLKDGDNIVWCYTCNGLGADVGGSVY